MNRTFINLLLTLFFLFLLVSCSGKTPKILDDLICEGQCWRNITLGESDIDEVVNKLKQMSDIDNGSIISEKIYLPFTEIAVSAKYDKNSYISMYFNNGKVVSFEFSPKPYYHLVSLIKKFGRPDKIYIQSINIGEPTTYLTVDILYEKQNICLHHETSLIWPFDDPKTYQIVPWTTIKYIDDASSSITDAQLKIGCLEGMYKAKDVFISHVQEWKGYGKYLVFRQGFPYSK